MIKGNKGVSLVIVVFAMMLLAVLGWTLVILQSTDFEANTRYLESERALYLAEAGLQHGFRNLIDNSSWRDTNPTTYYSLGHGEYIIKCEDGTGADAGYIVLTVTGYVPNHSNYLAKRIVKVRVVSFPWTEAIDAVHLLDWSRFWLQRFFTYVKGDLRAANWDGDNDSTYNETGFLFGDYNPPPAAMPLPTSGYDRLCGTVVLPDIDMQYYKSKAQGANHYVDAPYIFVADYTTTGSIDLHILNNIPAGPTLSGTCDIPSINSARDVNGYFYYSSKYYTCVVTDTRFQVVDVTNPAAPTTTSCGNQTITNGRGVFVRITSSDSTPNRNYATRAYVADGTSRYLRIMNISNPTSIPSPTNFTVASSGTAWDVWVRGNSFGNVYAYVAMGTAGFRIVEVTSTPTSRGSCTWTNNDVRGVYVRGGYAYVTDYNGSTTTSYLRIIDISDVNNPTLVASCALGTYSLGSNTKINVAIRGNYAYVAAGSNGFKVVDISNVANYGHLPGSGQPGYPDYTGQVVATYRPNSNEAIDVKISGDVASSTSSDKKTYAYVAYSSAYGGARLQVLDISTPTAIVAAGSYTINSGAGVFLYGDKYFQSGNYNNDKVYYTVGNIYIEGGNMNHTSLVAEGDIEVIGTTFLDMKAHVDTSAHENFPCLATKNGSILGSGGFSYLKFDGLVYSNTGNIDFDYYIDIINAVCFMGYNIYFDAITFIDYNDKYVGNPPSGFESNPDQVKEWKEI